MKTKAIFLKWKYRGGTSPFCYYSPTGMKKDPNGPIEMGQTRSSSAQEGRKFIQKVVWISSRSFEIINKLMPKSKKIISQLV